MQLTTKPYEPFVASVLNDANGSRTMTMISVVMEELQTVLSCIIFVHQ